MGTKRQIAAGKPGSGWRAVVVPLRQQGCLGRHHRIELRGMTPI
jgi:hypothetical protein